MKQITRVLGKISDALNTIASYLSLLFAFLVTIVALYAVFGRLLGVAPSWSEEIARWLTAGIAFIGGSVAFKQGDHVGVTSLVKISPKPLQRLLILIANILTLIFLGYAMYYGWQSAVNSMRVLGDIITIPMFYPRLSLPVGAAIMIVHTVYDIFGVLTEDEPLEYMVSQERSA